MQIFAAVFMIITEIVCLIKSYRFFGWHMFDFYTIISNFLAMLSTALLLAFGPGTFVTAFRFLSVCMMLMTMLVTVFVLTPLMKDAGLFSGTQFFFHLLCPILTTVSYVLWEDHSAAWYVPAAVTIVYGVVVMYLNYLEKMDGPYPFVRVKHQSRTATVVWIIVMFGAIFGIARGVIWLSGLV